MRIAESDLESCDCVGTLVVFAAVGIEPAAAKLGVSARTQSNLDLKV